MACDTCKANNVVLDYLNKWKNKLKTSYVCN